MARGAAVVALACGLAGCQSETPTPPINFVTPAPVRGVISQTGFENFEPDVWFSIELILSQRGVLDITVDWTYPDSWMYVYLGRTNCDYAQLSGRTCPFLISSETQKPKPRVLYTDTLDPGTYYLVLYNVPYDRVTGIGSKNTETVALQLGLTVSAAGGSSGSPIRLGRPVVVPAPQPAGP